MGDEDSSDLWINNEEKELIQLIEVEINDKYRLKSFPEEDDFNDPYSPSYTMGRGKKYINPNTEIMLFIKYFSDSDGNKFNSQTTIIKKIKVNAEVGSGLFSFRTHVGYFD